MDSAADETSLTAPTNNAVLKATRDGFDWDQGVVLLGAIFQALLLGMLLVEAAQYWLSYGRDSVHKKAFVALVCFGTLLQSGIEEAKAWWVLVQGEVMTDCKLYSFALALNGVMISLCQAFFIRRCWKLTHGSRWVLYPLMAMLFLTTFAIISYSAIVELGLRNIHAAQAAGTTVKHSPVLRHSYNVSINFWIWGTLFIDTVVAIITTIQLGKKKIGLPASDSVVQTFVYFVWETAALPQLCMITAGGLFHAETHNKRYNLIVLFVTIAGKIYVYMLLWTLNRRDALRKRFTALGEDTLDRFRWERGLTPSAESIPNIANGVNGSDAGGKEGAHRRGVGPSTSLTNEPRL